MPIRMAQRSRIAVVEIHGVIGNQVKISEFAHMIDSLSNNRRIRALLLDIDSPGGSATGSEVLYRSIQRVATSKPVYAYVRGIGASGGYYLACAASKIYALPTALIGSIGVIYLRPILEQLLTKVGIDFSVYKSGEFKDMTGFWRSPTDRESQKFQELIDEIFDNFVAVVANGRSLDDSVVREVATGEVMTAQRGKNCGLVDEIGDFKDALESVAEVAQCKPIPRWIRPSRSLGQRLMGRSGLLQRTPGQTLIAGLERVMVGGIYYLEPGHIGGSDFGFKDGN